MGRRRHSGAFWLVAAGFALLALFVAVLQYAPDPKRNAQRFGLQDKDILLYLEAITRIQEEAWFLDAKTTRREIIQGTLNAYLDRRDPYSGLLSPAEYRLYRDAQNEHFVGIGLHIEKNEAGEILCDPYPDSAAEKAGIRKGDRLMSIDGVAVTGKSLFAVAARARGEKGTALRLTVRTRAGAERTVEVTRSEETVRSVSIARFGTLPAIRLASFTQDTRSDLKRAVAEWDARVPLIIDLRGNPGGDLHAAIDSAMLFLPEGKTIVYVQSRKGSTRYASHNGAPLPAAPIFLWQDGATASAAEVFIAALTEHGRAVSIGEESYGKGSRQEILELTDGSAMVLTTGTVFTPKRRRLDGQGLIPTHAVGNGEPKTRDYVAKVEALTAGKR